MDRRINGMFNEENLKRQREHAKNSKYNAVLTKTIAHFDVEPHTHLVIYQNDEIMDQMETELDAKIAQMDTKAQQLAQMIRKVKKRTPNNNSVQLKIELIDQQIRILESTIKGLHL